MLFWLSSKFNDLFAEHICSKCVSVMLELNLNHGSHLCVTVLVTSYAANHIYVCYIFLLDSCIFYKRTTVAVLHGSSGSSGGAQGF